MLPIYNNGNKIYTKLRTKNMIYKGPTNRTPEFQFQQKKKQIEGKGRMKDALDLLYGKYNSEFLLTTAATLCRMLNKKQITTSIALFANVLNDTFDKIFPFDMKSKTYTNKEIKSIIGEDRLDLRLGVKTIKVIRDSQFPALLTEFCKNYVESELFTKKTLSIKEVEGLKLIMDYLVENNDKVGEVFRGKTRKLIYKHDDDGTPIKVIVRALQDEPIIEDVGCEIKDMDTHISVCD